MSVIKKIEDIQAWQKARQLIVKIYKLTSQGDWSKDFGFKDQIRRAAVSIACNIAEGYAKETKADFKRYLSIARGSASEVKTQLYIALDLNYLNEKDFKVIYKEIDEVSAMITGLMNYLYKSEQS